ncbi:MAG: hypothetical protein HY395_02970 [Candidatus Doudnabacteria bacterium]|nr:hypothetical protein [Candidatus Doudnabacteria bacterium]
MTNRTIVAVVILLAVLGLVFWWQEARDEDEPKKEAISSVSVDATQVRPGDFVVFTLNVENPNDSALSGYVVETNVSDLQELANLIDAEGANYNPATGSMLWTPLDIPKQNSITKRVKVQVKNELPADSDLVMRLKFGNEVAVVVTKPEVAGESSNASLDYVSPNSGLPSLVSIILAAFTTLAFSLYKFAKSG